MIPGIITLVVGIGIVIVSFFFADKKQEGTAEQLLSGGKENIEKQLDEYCNSLVEKKKSELKKQGEETKKSMQKSFDEVKKSSKKEMDELKKSSEKELDELKASSKQAIDEMKSSALGEIEDMKSDIEQRIEKALKSYRDNLSEAKKNMQSELETCSSQLSEKAKQQMIEYINDSLKAAYEDYDPDDTSEKEEITYDEAEKPEKAEPEAVEEATEATRESDAENSGDAPDETTAPTAAEAETTETDEAVMEAGTSDVQTSGAGAEPTEEALNIPDEQENAAYSDEPVVDSAFPVVEQENNQRSGAGSNRSKKKKKRKSNQKRPIEIWDEVEDMETKVADLHKKGLSIMEIANRLGIGVGEAKTMIDRIDKADETGKTEE